MRKKIASLLMFSGELMALVAIGASLIVVWVHPAYVSLVSKYPASLLCVVSGHKRECYAKLSAHYLADVSTAYAEGFLISLSSAGVVNQNDCHILAHNLGQEAVSHIGIEEALTAAKPFCADGFTHGVLKGVFKKNVDHGVPTKDAFLTCQSYGGEGASGYGACVHGLGHAFMYTMGTNVMAALHLCDAYENGRSRNMCYDGVFMEHMSLSGSLAMSALVNVHDPLLPCRIIDERYQSRCYWRSVSMQLAPWLGEENRGADVVTAVAKNVSKDYVEFFWHGIGREVDTVMLGNALRIREFCSKFPDDARISCLEGAVRHMLVLDGKNFSRADSFCASLAYKKDSESCFAVLKDIEYPDSLATAVRVKIVSP